MTEQLIFENNGSLDPRAIRTFGISAKEKQDAIGFFGTGLKYGIAIFLRMSFQVELYTNGEKYVFEKKDVDMRGKQFEIITMNGEELPFTTHLGTNWKTWMAFREFYCNALDEDGKIYVSNEPIGLDPNKTMFVLRGPGVIDLYNNKDQVVLGLPDGLKIWSNKVEIYNHPSQSLYYRKVRVMDYMVDQGMQNALYTYNIIDKTQLTEDRTLYNTHAAISEIGNAVSMMTDKQHIRRIITAPKGTMEYDLNFGNIFFWDEKVSPEFLEILEDEYKHGNDRLNKTAKEYLRRRMNRMATKSYQPSPLTMVEKKQLDRATEVVSKVWQDFHEYKILVVKNLGSDTFALADTLERTIVLSRKSFEMGTKFLASTLIEEYMHLKTGHSDCSRQLQTHLFDTLCTMIENHVINEPI